MSEAPSVNYTLPRVVAALMALPPTGFAAPLLVTSALKGFDPIAAGLGAAAGTMAGLCWWFALRGHLAESRARMAYAAAGGLIFGGFAFAAGFVGPIVFNPDANQGPLLGIFITGPLGFAAGTLLGVLYARLRRRQAR